MNSTLQLRYPGVDFLGDRSSGSFIDKEVTITPGARIDLSQGVQIRNRSIIGRDAIIEGGYIQCSTIHGRVSGGRIEDSEIEVFARITGGRLCRCTIRSHAQVQSGTLLDTIVADQGQVHGGQVTGCEISGNSRVTGGFLIQSIVQGNALIAGGEATDSKFTDRCRITGGVLINSVVQGDALVHTGRFSHAEIGHSIASLHRSSVGKDLPYQRVSITGIKPSLGLALSRLSSQPHVTHPPEVIIDRITKQLITDAVCTRDGETYNRSTISAQKTHAAYPNRAVQDISNLYREFIAVSGLIQKRGYTHRFPFQPPPIFDCITSGLVQDAVLCRCGHTYDRVSIKKWIRQHQSCPINAHPLREEDLYPNHAIQRLIVASTPNHMTILA
ncbi:hypothetical protein ZTR_09246 [Talaromyces verruculosus]|nr:hypothetical protein ZTR_09246 [Talaromyces verruculosus]